VLFEQADAALEALGAPQALAALTGRDEALRAGAEEEELLELSESEELALAAMQLSPLLAFAAALHEWLCLVEEAAMAAVAAEGAAASEPVSAKAAGTAYMAGQALCRMLTQPLSLSKAPVERIPALIVTACAYGLFQTETPCVSASQAAAILSSFEEALIALDPTGDDETAARMAGLSEAQLHGLRLALLDLVARTAAFDLDAGAAQHAEEERQQEAQQEIDAAVDSSDHKAGAVPWKPASPVASSYVNARHTSAAATVTDVPATWAAGVAASQQPAAARTRPAASSSSSSSSSSSAAAAASRSAFPQVYTPGAALYDPGHASFGGTPADPVRGDTFSPLASAVKRGHR
jgi:hypothetical protein